MIVSIRLTHNFGVITHLSQILQEIEASWDGLTLGYVIGCGVDGPG